MARPRNRNNNGGSAPKAQVHVPADVMCSLNRRSEDEGSTPSTLVHGYVERVLASNFLTDVFLNFVGENFHLFEGEAAAKVAALELAPFTSALLRYLVCLTGLLEETSRILQALISFHTCELAPKEDCHA
jgi:hypothetical protein